MFPRGGAINYNYKFVWLLRFFLIGQIAFHFICGALSFSFTAAHGGSEPHAAQTKSCCEQADRNKTLRK